MSCAKFLDWVFFFPFYILCDVHLSVSVYCFQLRLVFIFLHFIHRVQYELAGLSTLSEHLGLRTQFKSSVLEVPVLLLLLYINCGRASVAIELTYKRITMVCRVFYLYYAQMFLLANSELISEFWSNDLPFIVKLVLA